MKRARAARDLALALASTLALTVAPYAAAEELRSPDPTVLLDQDVQAAPILGPTYVVLEARYTAAFGGPGLLAGGQAGWTLDPHFVLGIAGYALVAGPSTSPDDGPLGRFPLAYGGLRGAYVLWPSRPLHLTLGALIGAGTVGISPEPSSGVYARGGADTLFVFEPTAEFEVNLSRVLRLAALAGYRYMPTPDFPGMSNSDVSGPVAGIAAKLGAF